jgi:hypothetical protein
MFSPSLWNPPLRGPKATMILPFTGHRNLRPLRRGGAFNGLGAGLFQAGCGVGRLEAVDVFGKLGGPRTGLTDGFR